MNTCVTCKHHRAATIDIDGEAMVNHTCLHPIAMDPVTGDAGKSCYAMRRDGEAFCGLMHARFWESNLRWFESDPPIVPWPQPPEAA
jgi:hypothetical protein